MKYFKPLLTIALVMMTLNVSAFAEEARTEARADANKQVRQTDRKIQSETAQKDTNKEETYEQIMARRPRHNSRY